jgi:hypothetical protein
MEFKTASKGALKLGVSVKCKTNKQDRWIPRIFFSGIKRPAPLLDNDVPTASQLIDMAENELLMSKMGFPISDFAQWGVPEAPTKISYVSQSDAF